MTWRSEKNDIILDFRGGFSVHLLKELTISNTIMNEKPVRGLLQKLIF
jgi:hypothetical protein